METPGGGSFKEALIIPNVDKEGIAQMVKTVGQCLERMGVKHFLLSDDAEALGNIDMPPTVERLDENVDLAIVLGGDGTVLHLSLIHISEPTRLGMISYAVFCLTKKKRI